MNATAPELQTKPAAADGVCVRCSWRHGRGPSIDPPPVSPGRCLLCQGAVLVMPPTLAELDGAALAWLGE